MSDDSNYWTAEHENCVIEYLQNPESIKEQRKFEKILYPTLRHMVENIMYKYYLHDVDMEKNEQVDDVMSFIMMKFDKYDPSRGCKAYSYYGTIAKNYMLMNSQKKMQQSISSTTIEDIVGFEFENELYEGNYVEQDDKLAPYVDYLSKEFGCLLNNIPQVYPKNVTIVISVIRYILDNYNTLNVRSHGQFYSLCQQMTGLSEKQVRYAMGKIPDIYNELKSKYW